MKAYNNAACYTVYTLSLTGYSLQSTTFRSMKLAPVLSRVKSCYMVVADETSLGIVKRVPAEETKRPRLDCWRHLLSMRCVDLYKTSCMASSGDTDGL